MSVQELALRSGSAEWAVKYLTPRNVGRCFGFNAMQTTAEVLWRRQVRAGDLAATVTDHLVHRDASVIDVGASWGEFSYHLARRVGRSGRVYTYEPHPINASVLQRLATARPHVRFRPLAVSDVEGTAEMMVPKHHHRLATAQSSLAHGFDGLAVDVERVEVRTARLDDEIDPDVPIDFVKIDVEGHEMAVLNGGAAMFRRWRPTMLIEIEQRHLATPIEDVFAALVDLGYHLFYLDGRLLRPIADFDVERDQSSKVAAGVFKPFNMPKGYVNDFCAVRTPEALRGLPVRRIGE